MQNSEFSDCFEKVENHTIQVTLGNRHFLDWFVYSLAIIRAISNDNKNASDRRIVCRDIFLDFSVVGAYFFS